MRRNATLLIIVDGVPRQHQRETVSFTRYSRQLKPLTVGPRDNKWLFSLSLSPFSNNLSDERFALAHQCGRARGMRTHTNSYKLQTCVTRSGPITLYALIVFVHPHGAKYYIQTEASCGLMAIVSPPPPLLPLDVLNVSLYYIEKRTVWLADFGCYSMLYVIIVYSVCTLE